MLLNFNPDTHTERFYLVNGRNVQEIDNRVLNGNFVKDTRANRLVDVNNPIVRNLCDLDVIMSKYDPLILK